MGVVKTLVEGAGRGFILVRVRQQLPNCSEKIMSHKSAE